MSGAHRLAVNCQIIAAVVICIWPTSSHAQPRDCEVTALTDPPGDLLTCRDGLIIRTERGSTYQLVDRDHNGQPERVDLSERGLLIELPPGRGRPRFQINTPFAIASVRGTIWAVDVTASRTSVFVQRGTVNVRQPTSRRSVMLQAGEGVDLESSGVLQVKRWPSDRVASLLARFGR